MLQLLGKERSAPLTCPCLLVCHVAAEEFVDPKEFGVALDDLLEEGIRRLQENGTWRRWEYEGVKFCDVDTFRQHMHDYHFGKNLLQLLSKDDPRGSETEAEAAFRQRMCNLLQTVQERLGVGNTDMPAKGGFEGQHGPRQQILQPPDQHQSIQLISTILSALEQVSHG